MTLYDTLVSIDPNFRFAALSAIANPKVQILHLKWKSDNGTRGCLFITAVSAARRIPISQIERSCESIASLLGLKEQLVEDGINTWDKMSRMQRRRLRARIRAYVETTYPVVAHFPAATPVNKSTDQDFLSRFLEACKLVGV